MYLSDEREAARGYLEEALSTLSVEVSSDHVHLLQGAPNKIIPDTVADHEHDLLVMGSVARKGIRGLLLGNTAETTAENVKCSLLLVKPVDFESPID